MSKTTTRIALSFTALLVFVPALHAQAIYAAKEYFKLQAGAGVMYLNNDYTQKSAQGAAFWGDCDFTHFKGVLIGAEAEVHMGGIITPDDIGENSFLVGPRFTIHRGRIGVYGKILIGKATITNQDLNQSSTYNVVPAYGGGLDYRLNRKVNIRIVDFEMQKWPNFEPNTLSPVSITIGASYVIK
jgi:hypothetical protein